MVVHHTTLVYKALVFAAVLLLFGASSSAASQYPPLAACFDPSLQQGLESRLADLKLDRAADRRKLCVALVDLTDPSRPRLAAVNGHTMMYAASLPKIAILFGAFDRIEKGDLPLDPPTEQALTCMIRQSSNRDATRMLRQVGESYLARLLQSDPYRFYDPAYNGGLWVGKAYGKAPAWRRDPLFNLSHGATAFQTARFYYLLHTGRLVSEESSRRMKAILGDPSICHKFVKGLEPISSGARIYRKSGSWRSFHSDSALIERNGRTYVAVALAHSPDGEKWLQRLIVGLDELIVPRRGSFLSSDAAGSPASDGPRRN